MARPRDVVKWLTGHIGYANYPKPDVVRPENRLMRAVNVWMGGTAGIAQRRRGMTSRYVTTDAVTSFTTVPVQSYDRVYTAPIFNGVDGFKTAPPAILNATVCTFSSAQAHYAFLGAVTINGFAYLVPTNKVLRVAVVDTARLGYPAPAAPTAANTGAGAYAATLRYYRLQWSDPSVYDLRGPVGDYLAFTPSGTGTGVVVTRPAFPTGISVGEWIVWGSADNITYYRLATVASGTTTYTDSTAPASYAGVTGEELADPLVPYPVRYAGLPAAGVPSVANTGAGAYAATLRYYRVRFVERLAGVVKRRGEPSSSVSFTPSGAGTAARISQPSFTTLLTNDYAATHWEIEASTDDANWYLLTTVSLSTGTYDDSAATSSYASGTVSDTLNQFQPPPVSRTMVCDRDRVLFGGGFTENLSRVWYTPVLGSLDVGDAERVPLDNYFDIEASDDDEITAMSGPVGGSVLVFKRRSLFRLVRTGNASAPYDVIKITEGVGVDTHTAVAMGPDASTFECVYFVNQHGAYRYSADGVECLSRDLAPEWRGQIDWDDPRVVYYPTRNCMVFGALVYHISTGGWSTMSWGGANAALMAIGRYDPQLYPNDDTKLLMPATTTGVYQADAPGTTTDVASAAFLAEIRTNRFALQQSTQQWRPVRLRVWGTSDDTVAVETWTDTNLLTPVTTGTVTLGTDSDEQDLSALLRPGPIEFLGLSVRDATATADRDDWTLDALEVTGIPQEPIP